MCLLLCDLLKQCLSNGCSFALLHEMLLIMKQSSRTCWTTWHKPSGIFWTEKYILLSLRDKKNCNGVVDSYKWSIDLCYQLCWVGWQTSCLAWQKPSPLDITRDLFNPVLSCLSCSQAPWMSSTSYHFQRSGRFNPVLSCLSCLQAPWMSSTSYHFQRSGRFNPVLSCLSCLQAPWMSSTSYHFQRSGGRPKAGVEQNL